MAKSDLGTKRICPTTGKKFYDLNKNPVISPYTGEVVPIAPIPPPRTRADAAARAAAAALARAASPRDDRVVTMGAIGTTSPVYGEITGLLFRS